MKKLFLSAAAALLFLAACGQADDGAQEADGGEGALKELVVEVLTAEDAFEPGVEGKIEILVTEGEEPVSDADEVLFEIWEHGQREDAEFIEGELEGDGKYFIEYTFEEAGYYYAIPHVTARGKHTMPTQAFNVGGVEKPEDEDEGHNEDEDHEHHNHH